MLQPHQINALQEQVKERLVTRPLRLSVRGVATPDYIWYTKNDTCVSTGMYITKYNCNDTICTCIPLDTMGIVECQKLIFKMGIVLTCCHYIFMAESYCDNNFRHKNIMHTR